MTYEFTVFFSDGEMLTIRADEVSYACETGIVLQRYTDDDGNECADWVAVFPPHAVKGIVRRDRIVA